MEFSYAFILPVRFERANCGFTPRYVSIGCSASIILGKLNFATLIMIIELCQDICMINDNQVVKKFTRVRLTNTKSQPNANHRSNQ